VEEFRKAVEMGYNLVQVFEVCEYTVPCFDKGSN